MAALGEEIGNIIIEKGKLIVKDFETRDKEIVNYFEEIEPETRKERFESAIKAGVTALKTVGMTERIDYIEKEFDNLNNKFSDTLINTVQELDAKYEEVFGEKGKFGDIIKQHFGEGGKIVKELLDPNREGTPLYSLKNDLRKEILDLGQKVGIKEKIDEVKKKTILKGADFQDVCEDILSNVSRVFGDLLEDTTEIPGKVKASKKGDFAVTIEENRKRIVFEVKDISSISTNEIQKTLAESIENREAAYGVLVVKYVKTLPKSVGWFQELGNNMLACALAADEDDEVLHEELLLIAYKWARTRIMLQGLKEKAVDGEFIQDKITTIQRKLVELKMVKTQCTNIKTASDTIRTTAERLEDEIGTELSQILSSLITK